MNFERLSCFLSELENEGVPLGAIKVNFKGQTVFEYIFGNDQYGNRLTFDEPLFLYSATKVITSTAALSLVEKGLINIDDMAEKYIAEFKEIKLKNTAKSPLNKLTLRHLFSMQSGISYDTSTTYIKNAIENKLPTVDFAREIAKEQINFEPGTHWEYGFSHDVLAAIIEIVTGMKYSEYVSKNIFEPLEMNDSTFHISDEIIEKMWPQYRFDEKNNCYTVEPKTNWFIFNNQYESGGAGLISTVNDYMKFADAMANKGKGRNGCHILSMDLINEMRKNQLGQQSYNDFWKKDSGYGYGLGVRTLIDTSLSKSPKGEFGWDSAACAYTAIDPDNDIAIFFGCHILGWGPGYQHHIKIRDLVYECLNIIF